MEASEAYYDRLDEIYPRADNKRRVIPLTAWNPIKDAYNGDDDPALLRALIDSEVPVFPTDGDIFVDACRDSHERIDLNPKSVARVISEVRRLSLREIGERIGAPIRASRQRGPQFQDWIATQYSTTTDVKELLAHDGPTPLLLHFGDQRLKAFAVEYLGYSGDRGLDAIIKVARKYLVLEAKLMTSRGGHQDKQVISALALSYERGFIENVIPVAVIDGVYLRRQKNNKYHRMLSESHIPVLHAFGLDAFVSHIAAGGDPHRVPASD